MRLQYYVTEESGKKIPIAIEEASSEDLASTKNSWQTDWNSEYLSDPSIEKYVAKTAGGEIVAFGAYKNISEALYVYIIYIESQPQSNPTLAPKKKYSGIGKMMVAFGIQLSIDSNYNGVVLLDAKTTELAHHYIEDFNAVPITSYTGSAPTLMIADEASWAIFKTYLTK